MPKRKVDRQPSLPSMQEYLSALLEVTDKKQKEISAEIGYERPNIITMFKQGLTKVPLEKVPALARALNADPIYMLRVALNDYMPTTLQAIEDVMGTLLTPHEREIIEIIRESTDHTNPHISTARQREELIRWSKSLTE